MAGEVVVGMYGTSGEDAEWDDNTSISVLMGRRMEARSAKLPNGNGNTNNSTSKNYDGSSTGKSSNGGVISSSSSSSGSSSSGSSSSRTSSSNIARANEKNWKCGVCTYVNEDEGLVASLKCSLCASRRPRERPKQHEEEEEEEEEEREEEEGEEEEEEEEEDEPVVKKQQNRKRKLEVLIVSAGRGKNKQWKCLVCTLSNALEAKRCEACYSYRPAEVAREVETAVEKKNKAKKKKQQQQQKEQKKQKKSTPGRIKKETKRRTSSSSKKRKSVDEEDQEDTGDSDDENEESENEKEENDEEDGEEEEETSSEGGYKSDEDGSGGWMTKSSSSSSSSSFSSSKAQQQQRETEWTCTQCTLVNSIRSRVCELCGITRAFAIRGEAPKIVKPRETTVKVLKFPHRESRVGVDFQVDPECFPTVGSYSEEGLDSSSDELVLIESELFETVWIAPASEQIDDEGTEKYLARFPAHQIRALQMLYEMNYELEKAAVEMQQLIDNGLVQQEQVYTKAIFEDEEAKQAFASALSKCGEEWKKVRLELGCRYNIRQLQDLFYGTFVNKECKPMRLEAERKYRVVIEREKEEKKRKSAQAAYEAKKALLSCASTSRDEVQQGDDVTAAATTTIDQETPQDVQKAMDIAKEEEQEPQQRQHKQKEEAEEEAKEEAKQEAEEKAASNGHVEDEKRDEAEKMTIEEVAV